MPHPYRKLTEHERKEEVIYRLQLRQSHAEHTRQLREKGLID